MSAVKYKQIDPLPLTELAPIKSTKPVILQELL